MLDVFFDFTKIAYEAFLFAAAAHADEIKWFFEVNSAFE